ncbi:MAG: lamin tail domain-containing protein [Fibrobacter sp.]|uniref:lamin tail domain-containing protein n=1 Tax=Fibrobacter sp. TaxID=35828 RepID=UPI0025BA8219|nr:lamin tail domain-containing protein [Fibrobacter sp.]MBQ7079515.1 lamin tail domain-containing protein [Fibrobacter sp.]
MSPTFKKHVCRYAATTLTALALWNCSSDSSHDDSIQAFQLGTQANVALNLDYSDTPLIDSLVLDCYGPDTLHFVHSVEKKLFNLDVFPSDEWIFKAKLYANGTLMQEGEITTALEAGATINLKIPMHALVGFVYVEIPIGFGNPAGIKKGEMKLTSKDESYTYPMVFNSDNVSFKSGDLKLNREYHITLTMQDESGKSIFSLEDDFSLDENSPIPNFQIASLRSKIALAIELAKDVNVQVTLKLPATKRAPVVNDLIVSEFFVVANDKDSSQYNFVELYNGSTDTLALDKCSLGKTSSVTGAADIGTTSLPPNEVLVVGNRGTANIAGIYKYAENMPQFGKTSGSIVLQCDGNVLDSLYYGKSDSLHVAPLSVGSSSGDNRKSTQLNIGLWNKRNEPESWCTGAPTPGSISACGN